MMSKDIPLHVVFAEARIKKDDKYLVAKRSSKDDQSADTRAVPGGKVEMELGHNIIETSLKREILEEVGIEIFDNLTYLNSGGFYRSSGDHVVALSFLAKYKSGEALPLEDQDEVRWVTMEELKILLTDKHWKDTIIRLEQESKNDF